MQVSVFKTDKVTSQSHNLYDLLDVTLPKLKEGSVVVIAAKIVSLCEGRTIPISEIDKDQLVQQESQLFVPREHSPYHSSFTITQNFLIPGAGIDESNANDNYILWPKNPQASANAVRQHLSEKHGLTQIGVVISDSTSRMMQRGTTGIALAHSGFTALKDYVGAKDIFNREMRFQKSNIANGLAASAVLLMGEGAEQTPIALIEDVSFIDFVSGDPSDAELAELRFTPEEDLFWSLIKDAPWQQGESYN